MTPDVNVLVAASRSDHPHHKKAYAWLVHALENAAKGNTLCLQPMVVMSYVRLVTHRRIFVNPTPTTKALAFIDALLALPGVEMSVLGEEWPVFHQLCENLNLTANDIPDGWLAAAAICQGEQVASFDKDFKRLLPSQQFILLEESGDGRRGTGDN